MPPLPGFFQFLKKPEMIGFHRLNIDLKCESSFHKTSRRAIVTSEKVVVAAVASLESIPVPEAPVSVPEADS